MVDCGKRMARWMLPVLAAAVLAAAVLALVPPAGHAVGRLGVGCVAITSGSMEPALHTGSLALVIRQGSYEAGDIVTYRSEGGALVTHRMAEQDGVSFTAQGDANNVADAPLPLEAIEGKVLAAVPAVGTAAMLAKTHPAALIAAVAAVVFAGYAARGIRGRGDEK